MRCWQKDGLGHAERYGVFLGPENNARLTAGEQRPQPHRELDSAKNLNEHESAFLPRPMSTRQCGPPNRFIRAW